MIESIRHRSLKLLWEKDDHSKINAAHLAKVRMILTLLDNAVKIEDMNFAGANLRPLKGDSVGLWAVINANYRLIFRFENENAFDVDYIDYH